MNSAQLLSIQRPKNHLPNSKHLRVQHATRRSFIHGDITWLDQRNPAPACLQMSMDQADEMVPLLMSAPVAPAVAFCKAETWKSNEGSCMKRSGSEADYLGASKDTTGWAGTPSPASIPPSTSSTSSSRTPKPNLGPALQSYSVGPSGTPTSPSAIPKDQFLLIDCRKSSSDLYDAFVSLTGGQKLRHFRSIVCLHGSITGDMVRKGEGCCYTQRSRPRWSVQQCVELLAEVQVDAGVKTVHLLSVSRFHVMRSYVDAFKSLNELVVWTSPEKAPLFEERGWWDTTKMRAEVLSNADSWVVGTSVVAHVPLPTKKPSFLKALWEQIRLPPGRIVGEEYHPIRRCLDLF